MNQNNATSSRRGMTLVEVMIAAMIFTALSVSTTAVFLRNYRMMTAFRYRTHVTNAALNLLEQLRLNQYATIKAYHDKPGTILVSLADPTYSAPSPDPYKKLVPTGYRPILLNLNVLDDKERDANWTIVDLPLESAATAPKMHARFWTSIKANVTTTTPVVEVYEVAVVYQWKNPAADSSQAWQSSTIRLALPNPNPKT